MVRLSFFVTKTTYMKHIILTTSLLTLSITGNLFAQDVIKFKNGDELKVEVKEITPQEIKYKRFDNLEGPLITILKNTATSIRYENGVVENLSEATSPADTYTDGINNTYSLQPNTFVVGDIVSTQHYNKVREGKVLRMNNRNNTALVEIDRDGKSDKLYVPIGELTLIKTSRSASEIASQSTKYARPIEGENLYAKGQSDAARYYKGYHGAGTGTFLTAFLAGPIFGLIPAAACSSTSPKQNRLGIPSPMLTQNSSYMSGYTQEAHRIKSRKVWGNYGAGAGLAIAVVLILASSYR